jgi:hypothetical protein
MTDEHSPTPEPGTPIWMRMTIPGSKKTERPLLLKVDARIERVEIDGFAVSFRTVPD